MPEQIHKQSPAQHPPFEDQESTMQRSMAPPTFQLSASATTPPPSNGKPPVQAKFSIFRDNQQKKEYISLPKSKKNSNNNGMDVDNDNSNNNDNSKADPFAQADDTTLIVKNFATLLDSCVEKAYKYVIAKPDLGKFHDLDGHTSKWVQKIKNKKAGNALSTFFGYAVESITGALLPSTFQDLKVFTQASRGDTRPDIVLRRNLKDIAWLDITASNSAGHINNKAGGWGDAAAARYAVEVTYPSKTTEDFKELRKLALAAKDEENNNDNNNEDDIDDIIGDADEILKKLEAAKALTKLQKTHWKNWKNLLKQEVFKVLTKTIGLKQEIKNFLLLKDKTEHYNAFNQLVRIQIPITQTILKCFYADHITAPKIPMDNGNKEFPTHANQIVLEKALRDGYRDFYDIFREVPNILKALGHNPKNFLFSQKADELEGQDWLRMNDIHTPNQLGAQLPNNYAHLMNNSIKTHEFESKIQGILPPKIQGSTPLNWGNDESKESNNNNNNEDHFNGSGITSEKKKKINNYAPPSMGGLQGIHGPPNLEELPPLEIKPKKMYNSVHHPVKTQSFYHPYAKNYVPHLPSMANFQLQVLSYSHTFRIFLRAIHGTGTIEVKIGQIFEFKEGRFVLVLENGNLVLKPYHVPSLLDSFINKNNHHNNNNGGGMGGSGYLING